MKHHKYLSISVFIIFIIFPFFVYAKINPLVKPIGGRIVKSGKSAEIVCAASAGPIFIKSFGNATPGPFFIRNTDKGMPRQNGLILGNYTVVPDVGTCYNPATGAPITAFELRPYGTSR